MAKYDKALDKCVTCNCGAGKPVIKKIRNRGFSVACPADGCVHKGYSKDLDQAVQNWNRSQAGSR